MNKNSYYIALVPSVKISEEILKFKQAAESKFGTKLALRSPAHVTLVPPFIANDDELKQVLTILKAQIKQHKELSITIDGCSNFGSHTIYLQVKNNSRINKLFEDLFDLVAKVVNPAGYRQFVPHITLANRDIPSQSFSEMLTYFKAFNYQCQTVINQVAIFKLVDQKWQLHKTYVLSK